MSTLIKTRDLIEGFTGAINRHVHIDVNTCVPISPTYKNSHVFIGAYIDIKRDSSLYNISTINLTLLLRICCQIICYFIFIFGSFKIFELKEFP